MMYHDVQANHGAHVLSLTFVTIFGTKRGVASGRFSTSLFFFLHASEATYSPVPAQKLRSDERVRITYSDILVDEYIELRRVTIAASASKKTGDRCSHRTTKQKKKIDESC